MIQDKYVAYDADSGVYETFNLFAHAERWIKACFGKGFGEETCAGNSYIAKITHTTSYKITDKKGDYHEHTDECPDVCNKEEWPYGSEFDTVGEIILNEV